MESNTPSTSEPLLLGSPESGPNEGAKGRTFLGHPLGLYLLFFVEMWERFSFYGMKGLLFLYMAASAERVVNAKGIVNPGRDWTNAEASVLVGWYSGLAYLFPIIGGIIADKLIGTHRSMVVGGILIALGHIVLGVSGIGALAENRAGLAMFISGLALIVLGTGHFKPTVSVMVGQLYPQNDPRREGGYSIFYMGINLGALICPFICGTLGEKVGWHWGFGAAAVGMILGLCLYVFGRPFLLKGIGEAPSRQAGGRPSSAVWFLVGSIVLGTAFGAAFYYGALSKVGELMTFLATHAWYGKAVAGTLIAGVLGWIVWFLSINRREDRFPVLTIFIYIAFNAVFWMAFDQSASSMTLYADTYTNLNIAGWTVPTSWMQSLNPFFIILLAPIMLLAWRALSRMRLNVPQPAKIACGLIFVGLGFAVLVYAAHSIKAGVEPVPKGTILSPTMQASVLYLVAAYFLHTVGEVCLSPTGLSYVTKTAPVKFVSMLMGLWFVSSFVSGLGGGLLAAQVQAVEEGKVKLPWSFGGQADFFMLFVVSSIGAGVLILALTPILIRWQRSRED